MKKIKKKHFLIGIWIAALVLIKFLFFKLDYDRYHQAVSISTFLLYLSIILLATSYFLKKKYVVLSNIGILITLLVTLEFVSYLILGLPKKEWKDYVTNYLPPEHKGSYLGNVPWADSVIHDVQIFEEDTFADVSYSIDHLNRRRTPKSDSGKNKYALFFGCSVCFGFGLEDDETIPYLVQSKTLSYNAYNYAYNGWGPHQMLSLFEHENLSDQIEEKEGFAVYIFLWSHIRRAIGDFQVYTGWGHTMPYYVLENESVSFKGNFAQRGIVSRLYEKLYKLYSIRLFELNFPVYTNEEHYLLIAEILNKSKKIYGEQFGNDEFTVLIYPDIWDELDDERMKLFLSLLDERNINYVNYSEKTYLIKDSYILKDGHPNAKSNTEITDMLIKDLHLN